MEIFQEYRHSVKQFGSRLCFVRLNLGQNCQWSDDNISQQQTKSSAIDGKYFNKQLPDYRNLDAIVCISLLLQEDIAYTRLLCFSTGPPPPKKKSVLWQTVKTQMKCNIKPYIMACFMLPYIWAISDPCGII